MLEMLGGGRRPVKLNLLKAYISVKRLGRLLRFKKKKRKDSRPKECDRRFGVIALGNLVSIQIETSKRMPKL